MANYPAIIHLRPEVRDFIRNRVWVHRGEAISYGPNISCDSFSTDRNGFRHSTYKGETLSVGDCLRQNRYGIVLGPSNVYGFGLAGNENTMPSLLIRFCPSSIRRIWSTGSPRVARISLVFTSLMRMATISLD